MQITIGIPSYNEGMTIRSLLEAVEMQYMDGEHRIVEIIVCDDSTDTTADIVNDFASKSKMNIKLIHHNRRRGAGSAWNEIFRNAMGDTIVLYDADVIPAKNTTLLLASRIRDDIALCASNPSPLKQTSIAGKAASFNALWLRRVRKHVLSQYTAMGRALSIRADIAKLITVPDIIAIDLYIQCKVLESGNEVDYCDDAVVWFKPTGTLLDFASQIVRAVQGHSQISEYVERFHIKLHTSLLLKETMKQAFRDPQGMMALAIAYITFPIYKAKISKDAEKTIWHISNSTKGINASDLPN